MFSEKQLEMIDKVFDTYHADYFQIMGYEIGIANGDLAQADADCPDALSYRIERQGDWGNFWFGEKQRVQAET